MEPIIHVVVGARGGQGTSTVAAVLAVLASARSRTILVSRDPAASRAILGVPALDRTGRLTEVSPRLFVAGDDTVAESEEDTTVIVDDTRLGAQREPWPAPDTAWRWLVLRGPCYVALEAAVAGGWNPHGVILLREPKRALRAVDVAQVLDVPVVAEVPFSHEVSRSIDAGTLLGWAHRLAAFRGLAQLVAPGLHPAYREARHSARPC
ncbi:MAG: hypothetical protein HYU28_05785 [Actinobacteria bacterium]|nr:hypothetical protein [Actinomycetota bacterium]